MAARFWVGGSGTWNASNTANWAATSGGAGGQSVPTSADTVTIDANSGSGTITVATDFSITSLTCGAMNMTLDFSVNNNNPTMSTFSGTGTGTRTLNMGGGIWTITGTGTVWNLATITNLTFNAQQSKILISNTSATACTFSTGNLTYYTLEYGRGGGGGQLIFSGTCTITNFIDLTSTAAHVISFTAAQTFSFHRFNVKGSAGALVTINRVGGSNPTLTKIGRGIVCYCDYITMGTVSCTPSNTWYIGANSSIGTSSGTIASNAPSSQSLLGIGGVG